MSRFSKASLAVTGAAALLSLASLPACSAAGGAAPAEQVSTSQQDLFALSTAIWPVRFIPVCWEQAGSDADKLLVQNAITRTWQDSSGLVFNWSGVCPVAPLFAGIRINVGDTIHPHTNGLGTQLLGVPNGMELSFTFLDPDFAPCRASEAARQSCLQSIAVHEFGHALGFSHEQNRDDTPAGCPNRQGEDGDTKIGPWDLSSVMNYCNVIYNNNSILSPQDVSGVRRYYGIPAPFVRDDGWCTGAYGQLIVGDFNGDRRNDLLCHQTQTGHKWVSLSTPTGQNVGTTWQGLDGWCTGADARLLSGDFNGDGRTDLLCHRQSDGFKWIALARSDGRFAGTDWGSPMQWCWGAATLSTGDFNGDGKTDLMCRATANGHIWLAMADANGHFSGTSWQGMDNWCSGNGAQVFLGDFNGDAMTDLLCHRPSDGYKWIAYNAGGAFFSTGWQAALQWCTGSGAELHVGDMNGDFRTDLVCHRTSDGYKWIAYADENGQFAGTSLEMDLRLCASPNGQLELKPFSGMSSDFFCHDKVTGLKTTVFSL